jgi:hypothetical protein
MQRRRNGNVFTAAQSEGLSGRELCEYFEVVDEEGRY